MEQPAVLLVHGLPLWRDPVRGWITSCGAAVLEAQAKPVSFTYSRWTGLVALLRPHGTTATRVTREFLETYARVRDAHGVPAVIAHSLGSYLVTRALAEHEGEVAFRGVIFFGSIVRPEYDWGRVVRRGQVPGRYLRNEVGLHDWPVRWARLLGSAGYPYGSAGIEGFRCRPRRTAINHPYVGAADPEGLGRYCREVWLPFLGLTAARPEPDATRRWIPSPPRLLPPRPDLPTVRPPAGPPTRTVTPPRPDAPARPARTGRPRRARLSSASWGRRGIRPSPPAPGSPGSHPPRAG